MLGKSKYLEHLFDAGIITLLSSIKSEILENMFDALVVTVLINMFVYI